MTDLSIAILSREGNYRALNESSLWSEFLTGGREIFPSDRKYGSGVYLK